MLPYLPLVQTIVERVLGWPVAIAIIFFLFRRSFASLLQQVEVFKLKGGGVETELSVARVIKDQQEAREGPPAAISSSAELATSTEVGLTGEIAQRRQQMMTYGGNDPVILDQIRLIDEDLKRTGFEVGTRETFDLLVRQLAVMQLAHQFESVYRLIFGSQIRVLKQLRSLGPLNAADLESIYESAKISSPLVYSQFSFPEWIGFLQGRGLVERTADEFVLTASGKAFLEYLSAIKASDKPH